MLHSKVMTLAGLASTIGFGGLALASGMFLVPDVATAQTVWFVDADAPGPAHDGSAWASAFTDLQAALAATSGDDEIWVASGTYRPTSGSPRSATFQLASGVALYGGFLGNAHPMGGETLLSERVLDTDGHPVNETVLSGDLLGDDSPVACTQDSPDCDSFGRRCIGGSCVIKQNNGENSYHVVTASGTDASVVLDGFTITGGYTTESEGAGLRVLGSPTIRNCTIRHNWSTFKGGGVAVISGNPSFINCSIGQNLANYTAGGVYVDATAGEATFLDCQFDENTARDFSANTGWYGAVDIRSAGEFRNCTFSQNLAHISGGAIGCRGVASFTDCVIEDNNARSGGGMDVTLGGVVDLHACAIRANSANYSGANWSGIGGGIAVWSGSVVTLVDTVIEENRSSNGGGIRALDSEIRAANCVIRGNVAGGIGWPGSGWGGGVGLWESQMYMVGCRIYDNLGFWQAGGIGVEGPIGERGAGSPTGGDGWSTGGGYPAEPDALGGFNDRREVMGHSTTGPRIGVETRISNCVFSGNRLGYWNHGAVGSSLHIQAENVSVDGCTFTNNEWYALYCDSSGSLTVANCIAWGNSGGELGLSGGFVSVSYSNFEGGVTAVGNAGGSLDWGAGNIELDPAFVDADGPDVIPGTEDDDLRLLAESPCIDAGDNDAVADDMLDLDEDGITAEPIPLDANGNARFLDDLAAEDTGSGTRPIVDMGAYEFLVDCNDNGMPDLFDIFCGAGADCNDNGVPDECEPDCDADGTPDECEPDCNTNEVPDDCDIIADTSSDVNSNGVPDECEGLLDFNISEIPPQTAWHDETLQFLVHSDDLGPGASFSIQPAPEPLGVISIDSASGLFTYAPDPQDKDPFSVLFVAELGLDSASQDVPFQPFPNLPPEQTLFGLEPGTSLPDPEAREYIVRSEVWSDAPEHFNTQTRPTRTITIAGKTIVFEEGHANGLYDYNENDNIREMIISAETVIFRSPLHLPQTAVTIYARTLRMEDPIGMPGEARIDTTPRSLTVLPAQFQDGIHGHDAGNITLRIDSYEVNQEGPCGPVGQAPRFVFGGGDGQPAGLGRKGDQGASMSPIGSWHGNPWPDNAVHGLWISDDCPPCDWELTGVDDWPGDGEDAIPGGKPGNGGAGGILASTLSAVSIHFLSSGGSAGTNAGTSFGGPGGTPRPVVHAIKTPHRNWETSIEGFVFSGPGADAQGPPADVPVGQPGSFEELPRQWSWLTPAALHAIMAHARDAYVNGHMGFAEGVLTEYRILVLDYQAAPEWDDLLSITQLEFVQFLDEVNSLLHRIANNLDYFGNPAGWVPMLSFEVNRALFDNEIDRAIRVLYLSYWLQNVATDLQEKVDALATARQELQNEIDDYIADYNEASQLIPAINAEAENIGIRISVLQGRLVFKEQELLAHAEANVRGPFWKRALRKIGTIAKMIPVGQPYLGGVGLGLDLITNINPSDPWDAIQQIKGTVKTYNKDKADFGQAILDVTQVVQDIDFGSISTAISTLKTAGTSIYNMGKSIRDSLKDTQVPEDRLQAELKRLKAEDPVFNELVDEVSELTAQKKLFGEQLAVLLQKVANLPNGITQNLLAIDAMNRDISDGNAVIDDRVTDYLDQMERRARRRLLKYHYYMAKAFEYRMVQPYTGDLNLTNMFDLMVTLADADNSDENLSADDFDAIKALYEEQLSSVAEQIFDLYNANPPAHETGVRFNLSAEELDQLNAHEPVTINLMERGLFFPDEEDIRIVDYGVFDIQTTYLGTPPSSFALLDIDLTHSGESRIVGGGETYRFRHFTGTTTTPLVWSSRYDAIDDEITQQPISEADESLLLSLLSDAGIPTSSENVLLFSRPGGWSDIVLTKAVNTDNGTDIQIDFLRLELSFDFRVRAGSLKMLEVGPSEAGAMPYMQVSAIDVNDRQDGRGSFRRAYTAGESVTLTAEETYGQWTFKRWTDEFGSDLVPPATDPSLQLVMDDDVSVVASYLRCTTDYASFYECFAGPDVAPPAIATTGCDCLETFDADTDTDVDFQDFARFQRRFALH